MIVRTWHGWTTREDADTDQQLTFDGWTAVEGFAGPTRSTSVVPARVRQLLARYDQQAQHDAHISRHRPTHSH